LHEDIFAAHGAKIHETAFYAQNLPSDDGELAAIERAQACFE
jgi:hypothetical protein